MLGNPAYPTYQVFLAILVSALIAGLVMPLWIRLLKIDGIGQQIRADGPQSHLVKAGTPTMGGVIILLAVCLTCLIMAKPTTELFLAVGAMLATGALGLFDDVTKVVQKRSLGLTPTGKMIGLTAIVLVFFVIAVNFTDGLDGLAGGTVMMAMLVMAAICFLRGDVNLAIFCAACAGGCIGFLWYNAYPAQIFMGDTGSLALGGALAAVAVLTNTEVVSLVVGALFIAETLSVMIQVISFKATGKRVFLMAPIHHHFEKKGWAETKVVIRFWIVSAACGALGLALFFQLG